MMSRIFSLFLAIGIVSAVCPSSPTKYSTVTLPWGTVQARDCYPDLDLYVFPNVRFGQPTDGSSQGSTKRFAQPSPPPKVPNPDKVMLNTSSGPACIQLTAPSKPSCPPGGGDQGPHFGIPILAPSDGSNQVTSEDCLFLDIYVPVGAVTNSTTKLTDLPVIVWFYGGAYMFGSKDAKIPEGIPMYDGRGFIEAAQAMNQHVIFVTGNYRLGQMGWLAGSTIKSLANDTVAMPNAGLADQRLLLQFVRNNINLFGGSPSRVSAFGESAGAGSILHHLVMTDDKNQPVDPLFNQAVMMSPAYQWIWDDAVGGTEDGTFNAFADATKACHGQRAGDGLECLQNSKTTTTDLQNAMDIVWNNTKCSGVWNIGPVADGKVIKNLPAVTLKDPNFKFHPNFTALIATHVDDEAAFFVPTYVTETRGFTQLLTSFLPNNGNARTCIANQYKCPNDACDNKAQAQSMVQDSMFTCNVRFAYDATQSPSPALPVWLLAYNFFADSTWGDLAVHGTDILPAFWNSHTAPKIVAGTICDQVKERVPPLACDAYMRVTYLPDMEAIRKQYQGYLAAFALLGDPNQSGKIATPWAHPTPGDVLGNVLAVKDANFVSGTDNLTTESVCGFWACVAAAVTKGEPLSKCNCGVSDEGFVVVQGGDGNEDL